MKAGYCTYPPSIADDVAITEQHYGDRRAFIAGSTAAGRYVILGTTEHRVLQLVGESRAPLEICEEFQRRHQATLSLASLGGFLSKLDGLGILAGDRVKGAAEPQLAMGAQVYVRLKLFNPDGLFSRMIPYLRWVWTPGFLVATVSLMLGTLLLTLMNWAEVASYSLYAVREHYLQIFIAGTLVGFSHEFAHGLTCKFYGGRATEVGALMIYYVLPALYCNVSGVHLIPQRRHRLWVIAAGVYWQVLAGVVALLAWFIITPYTLLSDAAFSVFLGGVVDVVFNANPLIKLDGYYFLSQWLGLPNLMDRSRTYWRNLLSRTVFDEGGNQTAEQYGRRECAIYAVFGCVSFLYCAGLRVAIVCFAGRYLMDRFAVIGLALTAGLALFYMRHSLKQLISALPLKKRLEEFMASQDTTTSRVWRRRLILLVGLLLPGVPFFIPWNASVGNYGALIAIPQREAIIRAPADGTLILVNVQPGALVAGGNVVGRMANLQLDEQLVQFEAELARTNADRNRLLGELRTTEELAARAEAQWRQRQQEFLEVDAELRQIGVRFPPSLAALQAEMNSRRTRVQEAVLRQQRATKLFAEGLVARSELDAASAGASALSMEWTQAQERLEAALIEHRRHRDRSATDMDIARRDLAAERVIKEKLKTELESTNGLIRVLEQRRDILQRKRAQFDLVTPRPGIIFGDDLPSAVGRYFSHGAEILRVADTSELLLRIQVPEREMGDVCMQCRVRLKTRSFPDEAFHGVVSNIGGQSEKDQYGQAAYRVELTIENPNGLLRPGMTAFARIDFGRQTIGRIALHKIKQALRPELWML